MNRGFFYKPHVSVNARPFVPPAFPGICLYLNRQLVHCRVKADKVRYIYRKAVISIKLTLTQKSININSSFTAKPLKLQQDLLSHVFFSKSKLLSVPTVPTHFVSMVQQTLWCKIFLNHPIMGQFYCFPFRIVKGTLCRPFSTGCFRIIVDIIMLPASGQVTDLHLPEPPLSIHTIYTRLIIIIFHFLSSQLGLLC
ncbi:MAG: hypothetical protein RHS_5300 [Robinsoniella sp. RHS]|nr:MAG: hypothetical protein RHS_5300 [Robinsoniella sp. RHS]